MCRPRVSYLFLLLAYFWSRINAFAPVPCRTYRQLLSSSLRLHASEKDDASNGGDNPGLTPEERKDLLRRSRILPNDARKRRKNVAPGKATSVGARRVRSASRARQGVGASSRFLSQVRKAARAACRPDNNNNDSHGSISNSMNMQVDSHTVHQAIQDVLQRSSSISPGISAAFGSGLKSMGILGDTDISNMSTNDDGHGETLLVTDQYRLDVATPMDDLQVANLRLSVFSDFDSELRSQFCERSCKAIAHRRMRGALCVVCRDGQRIVASAECSYHEFFGSRLGQRRLSGTILYVTEVAVSPCSRRRGIGSHLLAAMDRLASENDTETLYLHVDVKNKAAIRLYEKAGYEIINSGDPMYEEFTKSLNLHPGATKGREHHLLSKNLAEPTWLPENKSRERAGEQMYSSLGFEVPA